MPYSGLPYADEQFGSEYVAFPERIHKFYDTEILIDNFVTLKFDTAIHIADAVNVPVDPTVLNYGTVVYPIDDSYTTVGNVFLRAESASVRVEQPAWIQTNLVAQDNTLCYINTFSPNFTNKGIFAFLNATTNSIITINADDYYGKDVYGHHTYGYYHSSPSVRMFIQGAYGSIVATGEQLFINGTNIASNILYGSGGYGEGQFGQQSNLANTGDSTLAYINSFLGAITDTQNIFIKAATDTTASQIVYLHAPSFVQSVRSAWIQSTVSPLSVRNYSFAYVASTGNTRANQASWVAAPYIQRAYLNAESAIGHSAYIEGFLGKAYSPSVHTYEDIDAKPYAKEPYGSIYAADLVATTTSVPREADYGSGAYGYDLFGGGNKIMQCYIYNLAQITAGHGAYIVGTVITTSTNHALYIAGFTSFELSLLVARGYINNYTGSSTPSKPSYITA